MSCTGHNCKDTDGGHSVACRYEYTLARLGLTDTPQMRVLFWDANDALIWNEETDSYVVPNPIHRHDSDCATNSRGAPDLLGPCDCSIAQLTLDQQYEADSRADQIYALSEKIWNAINEVDYDPMHPQFSTFSDPVKDRVIQYATDMVLGFPSINGAQSGSVGEAPAEEQT